MNKILIVFAHPRFENSKTNRALLTGVDGMENVTLDDLYEQYPDFNIDVDREKQRLAQSDVIVWHFPFYLYGPPALLKQWMDLVLEYGWAHGSPENTLKNKIVFIALTAGGARDSYAPDQRNGHPLCEFLLPFEQTAALCKMIYLPPFAVHGTHLLTDRQLAGHKEQYARLLSEMVRGEFDVASLRRHVYLNDWLADKG